VAFLDRARTVAPAGYNRWLVPPAALAIHLCIGQIYAYSVFNEPMSRLVGGSAPAPGDWSITTIGWIFSIALFCLGASAAVFGKWVERVGPRKTMFAAAVFFCGGFAVAAVGVWMHNIWIVYLGNGVLGGIGLGLGYISPVSTLIKWFPDRPGMATGMAIMGFGGGAMVASPLSVELMAFWSGSGGVGVAETFLTLAVGYFCLMSFGMLIVKVPAPDWSPAGWTPPDAAVNPMITRANVAADTAIRTPQFWLLFVVLMLNVTAGIGVLGQASLMIQETFSGSGSRTVTAGAAAGFVGLLSLFNMAGRFIWSSLSDRIGRKATYAVYFVLGMVLYISVPQFGRMGSVTLFVAAFAVIISMYGGGFATVPAYLRDMFGTYQVGAIHGRLLLAWSTAAIVGPVLVNYIRAYQLETLGRAPSEVYSTTMYIMAGLLLVGLAANLLVRPVHPRYHVDPETVREAA
jgi:MFS family permease